MRKLATNWLMSAMSLKKIFKESIAFDLIFNLLYRLLDNGNSLFGFSLGFHQIMYSVTPNVDLPVFP